MTSRQFLFGTVIADAPAFSPGVTADSQTAVNSQVDSSSASSPSSFVADQVHRLQIELRINHPDNLAEECRIAMLMRAAVLQLWTRFFVDVSQGRLAIAQEELQSIRDIVEAPVRDWTENVDLCAADGQYESPRLMPNKKGAKCFSWTHQATDTVTTIAFAQKALKSGDQYRIDEAVADLEIAVLGLLTRILKECRPGARRFHP